MPSPFKGEASLEAQVEYEYLFFELRFNIFGQVFKGRRRGPFLLRSTRASDMEWEVRRVVVPDIDQDLLFVVSFPG